MRWLALLALTASCRYFRDTPKVVDPPAGTPVVAQLDRGACFGKCPVYSVAVYQDGTVIYQGDTHVNVTGRRSRMLAKADLERLVQTFESRGFAGMDASYEKSSEEDPPTISLTFRGKTVTRVPGDPRTPPALLELEQELEVVTHADDWTGHVPKQKKDEMQKKSRFGPKE